MINNTLSSLMKQESCGDHKKTQQRVSNILLFYLYYRYMVCASNKWPYPNVHALAISTSCIHYKINMS